MPQKNKKPSNGGVLRARHPKARAPRNPPRIELALEPAPRSQKAKAARANVALPARPAKSPATARTPARKPGSVILPPKPRTRSSGQRPKSIVELARAAARATGKLRRPRVQGTRVASPAGVRLGTAVPSERETRAPLTDATWLALDASAARLGRAALDTEQRRAIHAALTGQHSLVLLPDEERAITCYEVCAPRLAQPTVVLSPIHAQLAWQHEALLRKDVDVVHVSPELSGLERSAALARIGRAGSLLVLLGPESLRASDLRQALTRSGVALFVVEEAHCVSALSHEQRPSYAELGAALRAFASPPVMALTRVASRLVREDIAKRLQLDSPLVVQAQPVRQNLRLVTQLARGEGRQASLVRLVQRLELPGLVLCATPHDVDSVYSALRGAGIVAHRHHSAMTAADRAKELSEFMSGARPAVMVAVSAFAPGSGLPGIGDQPEAAFGFGRGPRKRDLRSVVHYQSPASLEQYVREIQHAGLDGLPALCVMLHESSHRSLHEVMHAQHRFKATHIAELGRTLEASASAGRPLTLEALALGTGQSRRTTDRLTALLADVGVVTRTGGSVQVDCSTSELDEACRQIGAQLYALREGDARRLASVCAFAESSECKLSCLNQYFGQGEVSGCGRCNACVSELLAPSLESLAPSSSTRRVAVQQFAVQTANARSERVPQAPSSAELGEELGERAGARQGTGN